MSELAESLAWITYHRKSERLVKVAGTAAKNQDIILSNQLYEQAAIQELRAAEYFNRDGPKSKALGTLVCNAIDFYIKAEMHEEAEATAREWFTAKALPHDARNQMNCFVSGLRGNQCLS